MFAAVLGEHHHSVASKALFWSILLNLGIFALEVLGGIFSGSLALLSDAFHNLTDTLSLVAALFAIRLARRNRTPERTYGYRRAEVLVAFLNALFLFGVSAYLGYEALERLVHPVPLETRTALLVGLFGLLGNLVSVVLLLPSSRESLSVRSAFLHFLSDTLSSCVVVLGIVTVKFSGFTTLDALLSSGIIAFILRETVPLFRETLRILMQGTPLHVQPELVKERLERIEGVDNVHHLHVWSLNEKEHYAEFHVVAKCTTLEEADVLRESILQVLRGEFGIHHATIQLECRACGDQGLIVQE
ncbi:MAG: cation transporter [Candidatus Caldatribacterium sp.]|nr:cation transporter [Candidatus Caldatribacterium sp.]